MLIANIQNLSVVIQRATVNKAGLKLGFERSKRELLQAFVDARKVLKHFEFKPLEPRKAILLAILQNITTKVVEFRVAYGRHSLSVSEDLRTELIYLENLIEDLEKGVDNKDLQAVLTEVHEKLPVKPLTRERVENIEVKQLGKTKVLVKQLATLGSSPVIPWDENYEEISGQLKASVEDINEELKELRESDDFSKLDDTPSSRWLVDGEKDPHEGKYDGKRRDLAFGNLTDDEFANTMFMYDHRHGLGSMGLLQAGKDRIRWLSRKLEESLGREKDLRDALTAAEGDVSGLGTDLDDLRAHPFVGEVGQNRSSAAA